MDYFYTPPQLIDKDRLSIIDGEFAHLTHVMRKKSGDTICVVDGIGNAYDVTIRELTGRTAHCEVHAHRHLLNEPSTDLTMAVALLKNGSKFDFLVEKTTELGVKSIIPILTERTIPQHARVDRWQKLALAAMKQSGRCVLPRVGELTLFADFVVESRSKELRLIPHREAETPTLMDVAAQKPSNSVTLCIGPEGGFTEREIEVASEAGFVPVSLGRSRLRTETAAIVAAALVLTR